MAATSEGEPPKTLGLPVLQSPLGCVQNSGLLAVLTGVQVAVKVNNRDRAVSTVDGPQQGKGDGVVTAHSDDTGESLALDGRATLVGVGGRRTTENVEMALLNLGKSPSIVVTGQSLSA